MPMVDYQEVKRQIPISLVLRILPYRIYRIVGGDGYGPCPHSCVESMFKRGSYRCCSFDLVNGLYMCHRCKRGGNQLDLFKEAKGLTLYAAALRLCEEARIDVPFIRG